MLIYYYKKHLNTNKLTILPALNYFVLKINYSVCYSNILFETDSINLA